MLTTLTADMVLAVAEGEDPSGVDLLLPVTSELIAGIIAFAIVFFVAWKFAGPAINQTLEKRQAAIKGQIEAAETEKAEAAALLDDYKTQLAGARGDAARILDEAKQAGENVRNGIIAKANAEAEGIVGKARTEADTEKARALLEARSDMANLSLDLAEKVVRNSIDRDAQRSLVESYLADLDRMSN
ncbi:MAG: F0F1 ATP synthase subunit B [Actinomycetota bacterium]|nr:F0F1 ATP synthase subunit B [Actinomycetota bacterium]